MAIQNYYNVGDTSQKLIRGTAWRAQTFTTGESYTISNVKLKLYRDNLPGTVTVSIRATSSGKPTGEDLCVGTINGDTLPIDSLCELTKISFSSTLVLDADTKYSIVVRAIDSDTENGLFWRYGTGYASGNNCYYYNSGGSWSSGTEDMLFETYDGKVSNPTPANGVGNIMIRGISALKYLQWEPE